LDRGTTTAPFDMVVLNEMSRFHLALDALKHIPRLRLQATAAIVLFNKKLDEHHDYIRQELEDMPEIRDWQWTADFSDYTSPAPLAKGPPGKALFTGSQATTEQERGAPFRQTGAQASLLRASGIRPDKSTGWPGSSSKLSSAAGVMPAAV